MAGIGADIKDVLAELGTPITIYKPDGTEITGEFIDYENYFEQSTEFIRQNVYSADLSFDTQTGFGDLLFIDGLWCLVMNLKGTKFEQEMVIQNCFLVETNVLGQFQRRTSTRENMEKVTQWPVVRDNVRGLQLEDVRRPVQKVTEELNVPLINDILYMSRYMDIQVGDRWVPEIANQDEYYTVTNIIDRVYQGMFRVNLGADTRE